MNDKGSFCDSASLRAVTYVNAEQAPKTGIAGADPPSLKGKATVAALRGMTLDPRWRSCRGMGDGTRQEETNATRETPASDRMQVNALPARDEPGWSGSRRGP